MRRRALSKRLPLYTAFVKNVSVRRLAHQLDKTKIHMIYYGHGQRRERISEWKWTFTTFNLRNGREYMIEAESKEAAK